MTRRELLQLAASAPVLALGARSQSALDAAAFVNAPWAATAADGTAAPDSIRLTRTWNGAYCRSEITNRGAAPIALKDVTLFTLTHALPAATPLYGEGFQMLSQTGGAIGAIADLGNYTDVKHYRMPEPAGTRVVYNLLTMATPGAHQLLAFTSCRRFSGQFRILPGAIAVVLDLEGLTLGAGETWTLEEFMFLSGRDRESLLASLAARLAEHHPPLPFKTPPSGWCSWYCFGPKVTAQ